MPASRTQAATPSGVCSIATPRSSSTSAAPVFDEADRFPCLHTGAPAAAVTIAAIVETFTESEPSPPVPTMSTDRARSSSVSGTIFASAIAALSSPWSSSTDSPFARSATTKPAICAGVASPIRISDSAAPAASADRSVPEMRVLMTPDHPPYGASTDMGGETRRVAARQRGRYSARGCCRLDVGRCVSPCGGAAG